MYTCTINCSTYSIWVEGEGGNYPFTPHYKSKKYIFLLGDQFFSKSRRCSLLLFFKTNIVLFRKKGMPRYHDCFGFGKWIVSPKAVDGYVMSFVVSKYVNTNISKYFVFVD